MTSPTPGLSTRQLADLHSDGFLFPVDAITAAEAEALLGNVHAHLAASRAAGGDLAVFAMAPKFHLLRSWAYRLVHDERLLRIAESVVGPDILVWSTAIFCKEAGGTTDLALHQDSLLYQLDGAADRVVRVWLALTPANRRNGTLRYAPGTHRAGLLGHRHAATAAGRLRGDEVMVDFPDDRCRYVDLRAGQASLHNLLVAHGSGLNTSGTTRYNLAIDYLAPSVVPVGDLPDSALLVQGEDRYGHFLPERGPVDTDERATLTAFRAAVSRRIARLRSAREQVLSAGLLQDARSSSVAGPGQPQQVGGRSGD